MPAPDAQKPQGHKLVIVTGSGRSGTSTAAGTLKKLGLYVPQPEVRADSSNPRGFFEPRWAVDFHKRLLKEAHVRTLDARPDALAAVEAVTERPDVKTELIAWLETQLQGPQIVVKDPRAFWFKSLWTQVSNSMGLSPAFLTMLRHPAEVVGSRDMHYMKKKDEEWRHARETGHVAGWVNVVLTNERASRGQQRAFAHYTDLISDWRSTMTGVGRHLDLTFNSDLGAGEPHEVDDFIDVTLRRAQVTWADLDIPDGLRDLAENVWQGLDALSSDPADAEAMARLDKLRESYATMHAQSAALVHDHIDAKKRRVRERMARHYEQELARRSLKALPRRAARRVVPASVVRRVRELRAAR